MLDFESETALTHRVLDALSARTKAAMHNLANANTPGFKRYYVTFEDSLREALETGKHAGDVHPTVHRDDSGAPGQNNVSAMEELALLDKVKLMHDLFARRAGGYFGHINKAIRGH